MDISITISDLKQKIKVFVDGLGKTPGHTAKNISMSITCEAAELMEIFNWRSTSDIPIIIKENTQKIKNKSADIAFALLDFCNQLNLDLSDAIDEKLLLHAKKYPATQEYIRTYISDKSTTLAELKAKLKLFVDQRNWNQENHIINSLGVSIACEAAELMEIFNWKTEDEMAGVIHEKIKDIRYEVADIAFALLCFCYELDIDLSSAIEEKLLLTPQNTL